MHIQVSVSENLDIIAARSKSLTVFYINKVSDVFNKGKQIYGTYLNQTPTFEWYVVRYGSQDGHQKGMCYKKIGLCAQNLLTI